MARALAFLDSSTMRESNPAMRAIKQPAEKHRDQSSRGEQLSNGGGGKRDALDIH